MPISGPFSVAGENNTSGRICVTINTWSLTCPGPSMSPKKCLSPALHNGPVTFSNLPKPETPSISGASLPSFFIKKRGKQSLKMTLIISQPPPSLQMLQDLIRSSLTWIRMETVACLVQSSPPVMSIGRLEDRFPAVLSVEMALLMLSLVQNQKSPESANLLLTEAQTLFFQRVMLPGDGRSAG